jgi:hypothetical protein
MMKEHEEDIRHLEVATDTLGSMAHDMRDSLARSNKDLEELDQDMDSTLGKVRRAIQGVDRLLTKADGKPPLSPLSVVEMSTIVCCPTLFSLWSSSGFYAPLKQSASDSICFFFFLFFCGV